MPQLAQGFLQPGIRAWTIKPQRKQVAGYAGKPVSRSDEGEPFNSPLLSGESLPASALTRLPSSTKPIRPGQKWIGQPLETDGGIRAVTAVHYGGVG